MHLQGHICRHSEPSLLPFQSPTSHPCPLTTAWQSSCACLLKGQQAIAIGVSALQAGKRQAWGEGSTSEEMPDEWGLQGRPFTIRHQQCLNKPP